jgi:predicted nucleotidyltransferase
MPVDTIYLFGSYATGNVKENSDLDIYVITQDESKRQIEYIQEVRWAIKIDEGITKPYVKRFDLLVGYRSDFEVRSQYICSIEQEVLDHGVKLYVA